MTASHRTTDFALLDRVSRDATTTATDLVAGDPSVRGAVVLATCNRFEAYLDVDDDVDEARSTPLGSSADRVFTSLARSVGEDAAELQRSAEVLHGGDAVRHLFAVSSGLESVVVGEDEISGQVQRALTTARAEGTSSPPSVRARRLAAEGRSDEFLAGLEALYGVLVDPGRLASTDEAGTDGHSDGAIA